MTVHPAAAQGFATGSRAYERGRPSYHPEAVAWLADGLGLGPGSTLVDLAAGTGKLARLLVDRVAPGGRVVAIEPVAEMRARLAEVVPEVEVLDGTAEDLPLADGSADAVAVAQAFHWFDGPAALDEIARVLRPGGGLGLVWNVRDMGDPVQEAIEGLTEHLRGDTPSYRSGRWRSAFVVGDDRFTPLEEHVVAYRQEAVDADGLADRVGSTSFVANLDKAEREAVLAGVRALVPTGGTVALPYLSTAYRCRRR
ncbi:MAG: methyltransferase domain-containing protein [Actinomycetota bacterium]|nr:methyltransferase domain-containing protein [Actinomycetota bacterium]